MRRFVEGIDREQATLFPEYLQDWIDQDNPVRAIDAFDRKFCPTCGTHLFSEAEPRPHLVFVRVGTLDNPEIAKPSEAIWVSSAPSWAAIDPNLRQIEGQPPPAA